MKSLFESMLAVAAGCTYNGDENELALQYQQNQDERIFAKVFCGYFYFILGIANRYETHDEADKASWAMETLQHAFEKYDPAKGAGIYRLWAVYYTNKLASQAQTQQYDKRKSNHTALYHENEQYREYFCRWREDPWFSTYDSEFYFNHGADAGKAEIEIAKCELIATLEEAATGLTDNEVCYCTLQLHNEGKISNTDIAEILGVSPAAVTYIRRSLRRKLASLYPSYALEN